MIFVQCAICAIKIIAPRIQTDILSSLTVKGKLISHLRWNGWKFRWHIENRSCPECLIWKPTQVIDSIDCRHNNSWGNLYFISKNFDHVPAFWMADISEPSIKTVIFLSPNIGRCTREDAITLQKGYLVFHPLVEGIPDKVSLFQATSHRPFPLNDQSPPVFHTLFVPRSRDNRICWSIMLPFRCISIIQSRK